MNRASVPLIVVAKNNNSIVGAAELKFREMDIFPDYEHWLGGVYVEESARGAGVARAMVEDVMQRAKDIGVSKLYLQTEKLDGGIYADCGFKALKKCVYNERNVLVMVAALGE